MDCCLWLNRKKISSAAEIIDNFDLAAVRGYYLGGSLSEWLREHGGVGFADRLDTLDPADAQLNEKLAQVFGKSAGNAAEVFHGEVSGRHVICGGPSSGNSSAGSFPVGSGYGSFGSFRGFGSFSSGSFGFLGSYRFSLWEWEWEWRFGSRRGSFYGGSYGSYWFGSGSYVFSSFGSFSPGGSFMGGFGSFMGASSGGFITLDEYDRIMYECLRKYPLDRYGYGIHIV